MNLISWFVGGEEQSQDSMQCHAVWQENEEEKEY